MKQKHDRPKNKVTRNSDFLMVHLIQMGPVVLGMEWGQENVEISL